MKPLILLFLAAAPADVIFKPLILPTEPGAAVLIRKNGRTATHCYGLRDLRTRTPIDPVTNFRLASFTKQFTAASIMLLVHDGKLRYDQPVTDIFPDLPAYARAITIRHLLTHTSGLPDYEDLMKDGAWTATHQIQDDEALSLLKRTIAPQFAPGAKWSYSNSAYVVLGLVVAKVSGMTYPQFLHDRIFQPLRMTRTLAYVQGKNTVPNRAFGHSRQNGALVETDQSSTSATLGDGGIYSNLQDLAKWDEALEKHTLLSDSEMQPALQPVPQAPEAYGFGWYLNPFQNRPRMWHSGSTRGFSTVIDRFPKERLTIIVLCNRTDLEAPNLALQLATP